MAFGGISALELYRHYDICTDLVTWAQYLKYLE